MSNSATFELKTNESITEIQKCLSQRWKGHSVDVFIQPALLFQDIEDSIFCVLEYIFGEPEEEWMIRQSVDYLLNIALNHEIYYYRCSDFVGLVNPDRPVIDIEIDELFIEEYAPSIGASREEKYRIQKLLVK